MKLHLYLLLIAVTALPLVTTAQETTKETIVSGSVENTTTISEVGLYNGTESEDARKFYNQAADYAENRDFENAEKYYKKAIKKDPKYVEAYDNLALVYRRMGNMEQAIAYYQKSIELYPNGQMAHQNLAVVYTIIQDFPKATAEYEFLIRIKPDDPEGYFGLANTLLTQQRFDEALPHAHKALEIYEAVASHHLGDGYYLIGLIHFYKGEPEKARDYVRQARDNGTQIHENIAAELFPDEQPEAKDFKLEKPEDYPKYEQEVINGYDYLFSSPVGEEEDVRKAISGFLLQWITGSPDVSLEIHTDVLPYMEDCPDCLMIFMGAWTKYSLETRDFDNALKGSLAGTRAVIEFYTANRKALGKIKSIEKFADMQKEGTLAAYLVKAMASE